MQNLKKKKPFGGVGLGNIFSGKPLTVELNEQSKALLSPPPAYDSLATKSNKKITRAKIIHSYKPVLDDELELKNGGIVKVLNKETGEKGWWIGEINGKIGFFPNNFVKEIVKIENEKKFESKSLQDLKHLSKSNLSLIEKTEKKIEEYGALIKRLESYSLNFDKHLETFENNSNQYQSKSCGDFQMDFVNPAVTESKKNRISLEEDFDSFKKIVKDIQSELKEIKCSLNELKDLKNQVKELKIEMNRVKMLQN